MRPAFEKKSQGHKVLASRIILSQKMLREESDGLDCWDPLQDDCKMRGRRHKKRLDTMLPRFLLADGGGGANLLRPGGTRPICDAGHDLQP